MELCTTRALSSPAIQSHRLFTNTSPVLFNSSVHLKFGTHLSGAFSRKSTLLRATSDDNPGGASNFSGNKIEVVDTLEDGQSPDYTITLDKVSPVNQSVNNETRQPTSSEDESSSDEQMPPIDEFLENFNIKLESGDSYTILLYGGGALVAVWLLSAIVGAIDTIPVFPKLMEVVGLGYSLWFTTRYLLFKKNREELSSRIEELKQEILGSSDR